MKNVAMKSRTGKVVELSDGTILISFREEEDKTPRDFMVIESDILSEKDVMLAIPGAVVTWHFGLQDNGGARWRVEYLTFP
jgi:hypothetical protein